MCVEVHAMLAYIVLLFLVAGEQVGAVCKPACTYC